MVTMVTMMSHHDELPCPTGQSPLIRLFACCWWVICQQSLAACMVPHRCSIFVVFKHACVFHCKPFPEGLFCQECWRRLTLHRLRICSWL